MLKKLWVTFPSGRKGFYADVASHPNSPEKPEKYVYKQPELYKPPPQKSRSRKSYGLSELKKEELDLLLEDPWTAYYYEELVEEADKLEGSVLDEFTKPLSVACAKFLMNELFAAVNANGIRLEDIPADFAAQLLVDRRARKIKNQEIKELFRDLFKRQ